MKTIEDYRTFLAEVRKSTGIDALLPDETGLASVNVDDTYNLNLQFVEATGKVLCFVEVAQLPRDASKAVYRDLLVGGLFGKDTAGGYFAVEPESETVVYNYFFDLEVAAKDVEDFVHTIEKILQLCDIWAERIRRDLSGEDSEEGVAREIAPHSLHFNGSIIRA
ncbi:MAG: type III secretion system chaperone [Kiritimatiellae bacterium]|nr:type III secretion system chaperone [Kiritimatiellia bacterium]